MSKKDNSLGARMKENYENRSKTYLTRRVPVIIRLDGKAFHTYTKGFKKPYDEIFHKAMNETTKYLCQNIQGCKIGYTQSDEITLLLTDYETLTTDAWFDYSVQKMCSVSAAMATLAFNKYFTKFVREYTEDPDLFVCADTEDNSRENREKCQYGIVLINAIDKGAVFDARCFNVPKEEVTNCFVWRQQDATRNAVQMLGQSYFSHSQLKGKSNSDIQDMLMIKKGVNFNDMPVEFKRGICCIRNSYKDSECNELMFESEKEGTWVIDKNIPIFTAERDYIERYV